MGGDGNDIVAVRDPWLISRRISFENSNVYEGKNEKVSDLFYRNSKFWDVTKVHQQFLVEDAQTILATLVPQGSSRCRVVWANSTNGCYSAKTGYRLWHTLNIGISNVPQGEGWGKIWRLLLPPKMKIFLWHFCRNMIPVRRRLSNKEVQVPWLCPMCNIDVEHLAHLFFECDFLENVEFGRFEL